MRIEQILTADKILECPRCCCFWCIWVKGETKILRFCEDPSHLCAQCQDIDKKIETDSLMTIEQWVKE